jgi:hypothetical protein
MPVRPSTGFQEMKQVPSAPVPGRITRSGPDCQLCPEKSILLQSEPKRSSIKAYTSAKEILKYIPVQE